MFCPYCGNPCAETHKFCFRCGKALPEPAVKDPSPEAPVFDEVASDAVPVVTTFPETESVIAEQADCLTAVPATDETAISEPAPYTTPADEEPALPPKKGRLWPPLLALCLMICVGLSAFFLAPKTPEPVKSCFSIENGVLYFDDSLYTGSEELTVPDTVDGMAVTGISDNCFADCDRLTTIVLPETVTIIGDKAFSGCDALRGVYIPNGVLSIGAGALAQCPALEAVYFPGSLTEIGEGCLDDCTSLQYIIFDGTYAQWRDLYDGIFQNRVELHTNDGVYRAQP